MSGGYHCAFKKWLECSETTSSDETEEDDGQDLMETEHDSGDEADWYQEPPVVSVRHEDNASHDTAPTLLDDDDEVYPQEKNEFEDEPPVLEAAPKHDSKLPAPSSNKSCDSGDTGHKGFKNYSRLKLVKSSSLPAKSSVMKTYSSCNKKQSLGEMTDPDKTSMKENGNIFDKMTSLSDCEDVPPPLIPSPEAQDLQQADICATSHNSPNFVAMEADSTSELPGLRARHHSKSWPNPGDVTTSVECDSTCMFVASPHMVSPAASASEGEIRDQGGGGYTPPIQACPVPGHSGGERPATDNLHVCSKAASSVMASSSPSVSESKSVPSLDSLPLHNNHSPMLQGVEYAPLSKCAATYVSIPECAKEETVFRTKKDPSTTLVDVQRKAMLSSVDCDLDEPPVLTLVSAHPSPQRAKRHTIDSADTFSPSCKRPRTIHSPTTEDTSAHPPLIPHVSELLHANSTKDHLGNEASKGTTSSTKQRSLHQRPLRRRRCQSSSLPSTGTIRASVQHLPDNLKTQTVAMCHLANLKVRMHTLVQILFPSLKSEVQAMSPESIRFETLLSDLVQSLQVEDFDSPDLASKPSSHAHLSGKQESSQPSNQTIPQTAKCRSCRGSNGNVPGGDGLASTAGQCGELGHCAERKVLQDLSGLCLSPMDFCQPVSVPLSRDVKSGLWHFSHLSCLALQLLLPELTVSLGNELVQHPESLLVFMENVISANNSKY